MTRINSLMLDKREIYEFIREMEPHSHVIAFYEDQKDKFDILFTYLFSGFERGYAGAYVAGESSIEEVRQKMIEYGIDVETLEKKGALKIIDYIGWYIKDGKVDPNYTIDKWLSLLEEAKRQGYKSLRACGEMTVFFKHNLVDDLLRYEEMLDRRLEVAMMGLCAYNSKDFIGGREELLLRLIKAHEYVILVGPKAGLTIVKAD